MKKGMELPINMLVVVAVAVVVLMGVIAIYILGIGPFSQSVGLEAIKNSACSTLLRDGCTIQSKSIAVNTDANKDGWVCTPSTPGYVAPAKDSAGILQSGYCIIDTVRREIDTLLDLCANSFNKNSDSACKAFCGCPGYY